MQKVAKMTQSCNQIQIINLFATSLSNCGTTDGFGPFFASSSLGSMQSAQLAQCNPILTSRNSIEKKARLVKPNRILACHIYTTTRLLAKPELGGRWVRPQH